MRTQHNKPIKYAPCIGDFSLIGVSKGSLARLNMLSLTSQAQTNKQINYESYWWGILASNQVSRGHGFTVRCSRPCCSFPIFWYQVLDSNQHTPSCKDGPSPLGSTWHKSLGKPTRFPSPPVVCVGYQQEHSVVRALGFEPRTYWLKASCSSG